MLTTLKNIRTGINRAIQVFCGDYTPRDVVPLYAIGSGLQVFIRADDTAEHIETMITCLVGVMEELNKLPSGRTVKIYLGERMIRVTRIDDLFEIS